MSDTERLDNLGRRVEICTICGHMIRAGETLRRTSLTHTPRIDIEHGDPEVCIGHLRMARAARL